MRADLLRRRGLRVGAVLAIVAAVLVLAGRKVDLATLDSLSLAWRWIGASIALNAVSALLKVGVWSSVLRSMPTSPALPFRDLCRSLFIGLCLNTVVPGRVGEAARVATVTRRHPDAPVPVLVGSVVGEHLLSSVALIATTLVLLAGVDRTVAGRFETTLLGLLAVVGALAICVIAITLVLRTEVSRRHLRFLHVRPGGAVRLVREVAGGLRDGVAIFRSGRRGSSAIGFLMAIASAATQVASIYTALSAVGIQPTLGRAGAAFIASSLVGIFPLVPGNVGAFQAVVAASLVTFNVDFGLGFGFAIALQALEAAVGVGIGGWFLFREGLSIATYRDVPARVHEQ